MPNKLQILGFPFVAGLTIFSGALLAGERPSAPQTPASYPIEHSCQTTRDLFADVISRSGKKGTERRHLDNWYNEAKGVVTDLKGLYLVSHRVGYELGLNSPPSINEASAEEILQSGRHRFANAQKLYALALSNVLHGEPGLSFDF